MSKTFAFVLLLLSLVVRAQDVTTSAERTLRDFVRMGVPVYQAENTTLLPTGIIKFEDLFHSVEEAQHFIHLDYFKFQQDSVCRVFFDQLRRKARQGVEVRVVYDAVGNLNSDLPLRRTFIDSLRADGVQLASFDPFRFPWINHMFHRNHHKIAIIDGRMVYTGGMNVADYYLHGKPVVGEWRDMHARLEGSIVVGYERVFEDMWLRSTGQRLDDRYQTMCRPSDSQADGFLVALCDRVPCQSPSIMRDVYIASIDNAQSLIQIVNPYITFTSGIRRALRRALARGVRLQIMLSTKNDGPLLPDLSGLEMRKLQKRGAEVYYYNGGFHHTKLMMVDSTFCTIGTTNLDGRSLKFDYEVNAFLFDSATTHKLQQLFQRDVEERCSLLTDDEWHRRFPCRRKLKGYLLQPIKGLL